MYQSKHTSNADESVTKLSSFKSL